MDIYTTVTKELKLREFGNFEEKIKQQKKEWNEKADNDIEEEIIAVADDAKAKKTVKEFSKERAEREVIEYWKE